MAAPTLSSVARPYAVVIPSYSAHLGALQRNLLSWRTFCTDLHLVSFKVIVGVDEQKVFEQLDGEQQQRQQQDNRSALARIDDIEVMPIDVAVERSGETVSPLLRRLFGSTNRPLEAEYRNVYQSIKKLHGCLATPSPWCFCTDSEAGQLHTSTRPQ